MGLVSAEALEGGHAIRNPFLAYHSMGGMLVLFAAGLWTARGHLQGVLRKAILGAPEVDDSTEILSYRAALFALVGGSLSMAGWLWLVGTPLWAVVVLLLLAAALFIGFTRVVAEGGLSDGAPPVVPAGILVAFVGSSAIGAQGLVGLATTYMWTGNMRSFVMASCANSLKLAEELGRRKRPLLWALILALLIALSSAVWMILSLSYEHGALNMWIGSTGTSHMFAFEFVECLIRSPTPAHLWGWINTAIGAFIMLLLLARWRYQGWPLHPLGYPIGPIWIMDHLWFNMFLAWLIKLLVLKYGGLAFYRKPRPFFLGMILGHIVPGGFFLLVDHFTGMVGNVIFWG